MAVNKVYKIPRNILAEMTKNNPQAIAALENIEQVTERSPQEMADIVIKVEGAITQAEQATIIATQTAAIINQALSDIRPTLNAVSVPQTQLDTLSAVTLSIDCPIQLLPV